uniref:Kinesin family member 13B n=2 Tax=Passeriformes TaxID=9126 RepID=A0A674GWI7_TAEGU
MGDSKVKVAVRVRPMNRRELDLHTKCVVDVDANKVILHPVNTNLSKGDARHHPRAADLGQSPSLPVK